MFHVRMIDESIIKLIRTLFQIALKIKSWRHQSKKKQPLKSSNSLSSFTGYISEQAALKKTKKQKQVSRQPHVLNLSETHRILAD